MAAKPESPAGADLFHLSLLPSGMITSLIRGLPSREIWTQGPLSV